MNIIITEKLLLNIGITNVNVSWFIRNKLIGIQLKTLKDINSNFHPILKEVQQKINNNVEFFNDGYIYTSRNYVSTFNYDDNIIKHETISKHCIYKKYDEKQNCILWYNNNNCMEINTYDKNNNLIRVEYHNNNNITIRDYNYDYYDNGQVKSINGIEIPLLNT